LIVNQEDPTETGHEAGYRIDQVLSNRHGDQNQNAVSTILQLAHLRYSVLLPIHELGEVLRIVSFALSNEQYETR
jgi:hypothetical protein